jgi:adenylate cyclase
MFDAANDLSAQLAPVPVSEAAFLFADISGYTAYTETQGDARAAELAWRLRLGVEGQLADDAHVVKTLGDAVMVRIADPVEAAAAGLRIVSRALPGAGDPPVRVGIHWGPAVEWAGDFFGAAVNLAARVASLARPGEVIVTATVAVVARRHGLQVDELGERTLRNVARPVLVHAVRDGFARSGPPPMATPYPSAPPRRRGSAGNSTSSEAAHARL